MVHAFQVKRDYKFRLTTANARFAGKENKKAVRVECNPMRIQFIDNAYIGTNIEGNLLHDDTSERWLGKYLVRQEEDNGIVYAHIIFYNSAPTSPYAEFIGVDPGNIITDLNMNGYASTSGRWTDLSFTHSTGTIARRNGSPSLTFTFAHRQATIQLASTSSFPKNIRITGNFTYRGGEDFATRAINANWNQDRIVFYQDAKFTDQNWVCFFTPIEGTHLPKATGFGEFKGVTWQDI